MRQAACRLVLTAAALLMSSPIVAQETFAPILYLLRYRTFDEAIAMTRRLSSDEGIFAGISTGANVVGAHRLAERLGPDAVIVTLAVDTGFKYLSVSPFADM